MSDCFGRRTDARVEWSIPMDNYADQVYKLLAHMEKEAAEYCIDTGYGDWFHAEVRDYEYADKIPGNQRKYQLTLWFDIPDC